MESSSSNSLSHWNYLNLLLLRPVLAVSFVFSFIIFGWLLAWKLVLVHVPLVQEIFGLRKKQFKPKPSGRGRLSRFYNGINASNSSLDCLMNSLSSAAGCSADFSEVPVAFFLPGPAETLTVAGLRSLSPRRNPRRNSSITIPSLNSSDSSRAIASCNYMKGKW
ncbi:hypothetical protein EZV62_022060 [Acer yangbiense]|uniref:Uncharacterized protein n=1 Tax=Acer yangbiense TaxID=1000413 RepID=A0A5C7H7G4_9ROSI|nr:hypothetical protein EZV62_022060 [Acer yangbiense]